MLMIRLRRMGSNRRPVYRVVVSDGRQTPTAAELEEVGIYNPLSNTAELTHNRERIDYWLGRGAQMSETVASLVGRSAT